MLGRLKSLLNLFGIDPTGTVQSLRAIPWFLRSLRAFRALGAASGDEFANGKLYPCLFDRADVGGTAAGHYFHQDMLVARRIYQRAPQRHADIGSRIDGFVAHIAVFRKIDVFDIRPVTNTVQNVEFRQLDLTQPISPQFEGAYDSVSCLHALEHFGLGRYGDALDYYGYLKGLNSIARLLSTNGVLYLSVPMGPQRIEFNAHRVFSLPYLKSICQDKFKIAQFSYVCDEGELHENMAVDSAEANRSYDCHYGLAILELIKR